MKHLRLSIVVALLLLQIACDDNEGTDEVQTIDSGSRRLDTVKTTYSNGRIDTIKYNYSDEGVLESYVLDSDGSLEDTTSYVYDSNGLVNRQEKDLNSDGAADTTVEYLYESGRLIARDYDVDMDQIADYRRVTSFDGEGRYSGYVQYGLTENGIQQDQQAIDVVTYQGNTQFSERDFAPLGSPDLRIEYMTLATGEMTTSVETYYTTEPSASVTQWKYENAVCDRRWLGSIFLDICLE